ncbi:MAG: NUDIX domain-containing protein [Deltaproteobacteria bacterium]|nr:MAG: NUDIX domain-containing protein [Deltaproteobacteria bacterium]
MKKDSTRPKEPRRASTVILIREEGGVLQVFLLERSGGSGSFPGNYVFPGGTVDPGDGNSELWKAHVDMDPKEVSRRLGGGLSEEEVFAFAVAAIRETFEEAGVLLAYRSEQTKGDLERVCERRMSTTGLHKDWAQELVVSEGWTLAFTMLARWAHWITPELMPYRFDTRFFMAFMPQGQECVPDTRETTQGIWVSPEKGLAGNLNGEIPLSAPTLVTLQELLQYSNIEELQKEVQSRPWGEALLPRLIPLPQGSLILEPWDPMYHSEFEIDPKELASSTLPLGEPFSRMCQHEGIWRPVEH